MKPKTILHYKVYRQDPPALIGQDYEAVLTLLGIVSGTTTDCWRQAYRMTVAPVLEHIDVH